MRAHISLMALLLALPACAQNLTWTLQDSGSTAGLRGIYSVDGTIAWASGTEGTILRTTDGGQHWTRCATPDAATTDGATLDFRGIQAFSAYTDIAIAMSSGPGDKSRLYKTTDGCKTWVLLLKNPDPAGFWDSYRVDTRDDLGILVGDPIKDHFPIWQIERGDDSSFAIERIRHTPRAGKGESAFAASNSAVFVDNVFFDYWIATGGKSGARVIKRINHDFDSFGYDTFPSGIVPVGHRTESSGIFALSFRPEPKNSNPERQFLIGIAVGGDYTKPNDPTGTAAFSTDGGLHWTASTTPPHGYRSTVQYSSDLKAWITAGTNGSDISHDDGGTWQPIDNGNWNALSLPFLVGPKGRIARLTISPTTKVPGP